MDAGAAGLCSIKQLISAAHLSIASQAYPPLQAVQWVALPAPLSQPKLHDLQAHTEHLLQSFEDRKLWLAAVD